MSKGDTLVVLATSADAIAVASLAPVWVCLRAIQIVNYCNKVQPQPALAHIRFDRIETELRKWAEFAESCADATEEEITQERMVAHEYLLKSIRELGGTAEGFEDITHARAMMQALTQQEPNT